MTRQHASAVARALLASVGLAVLAPSLSRLAGGIANAQAAPAKVASVAPPSDSLKVVLLGTGVGPLVNLQQFGASTLVEAGGQRFLFDCGRGATLRLAQAGVPIGAITRVFLTHLHSDHVVQLPDLLLAGWAAGRRTVPISVWGPTGTRAMMNHLLQAFDFDVHMRRDVDERFPAAGITVLSHDVAGDSVVFNEGGVVVTAFLVDHGPVRPAFGYRVDYRGRSVVLSGDTRVSENLIRHARGTDVLIHEVIDPAALRNRPDRPSADVIDAIIAHHTTPEQAGVIFGRVAPRLAVYSHAPNTARVLAQTRTTYSGPLQGAEDLLTIRIGADIQVEHYAPPQRVEPIGGVSVLPAAETVPIKEPAVPAKLTYTYKTVGALPLQADVYQPRTRGLRPVVVWIHPGGLMMGSRAMLPADELDRFLRAGFVVVAIDYRLAPETKLPEIVRDVEDAHRWIRARGAALFRGDPDRVADVGASGGAYLALLAGARVEPRLRAVVSFYGYGDITGPWYSRPDRFFTSLPRVSRSEAMEAIGSREISGAPPDGGRWDFYVYCRQNGLWPREVTGLAPGLAPEQYAPYSVEQLISPTYPATLLLHGDKDVDVPIAMSERLAAIFERQGVPHEFTRLEGFNHAFDVFDTYPPRGAPVGLSRPRASEAFDQAISFLTARLRLAGDHRE